MLSIDLAAAKLAVHTHVDYNVSPRSCEVLPALRVAGYTGLWGLEHHTEVDEMRKVELQLAQIRLAKCWRYHLTYPRGKRFSGFLLCLLEL
ncbi:hypothetical protein AGMMS49992_19490 [Clostridia bacterium]|nr:hypothetical protein AGMMS49992_19490 [Clostridia bacterium]